MTSSYKLKNQLIKLVLFLLIFGNAFIGKPFAQLRFEFIYINEFLFAALFLLFYRKNINFLYQAVLLLLIPMYQVLLKNYYFIDVLKDYALIYYPVVIYLVQSFDNKLIKMTKELFQKLFFIIPYIPLLYLINKWLFNNLRFTEIVVFSTIFYFQEDTSKFKNYQKYIFYIFFFIAVFQHRSSMLMIVIVITFLYLNDKILKKELFIIFLAIVIVLPLVFSSVIQDIFEVLTPVTNCTSFFNENPRTDLKYSSSEVCNWTNIEWRLTLWKTASYQIIDSGNYLFRNTFGENIIKKFYDDDLLPKYMFHGNKESGLRNLHNSFLTLIYRVGLIPFCLIFYVFFNYLRNLEYFEWFMFLVLIQTFFDPIIDGPVFAIPYYWILFYKIRENLTDLEREVD